jgi:hypothetical protein
MIWFLRDPSSYGKKVYDPGVISHEKLGVPALAGNSSSNFWFIIRIICETLFTWT